MLNLGLLVTRQSTGHNYNKVWAKQVKDRRIRVLTLTLKMSTD